MTDITANYHGGNAESVAAGASLGPGKQRLRARVVRWVTDQGIQGATSDEIETALVLSHQSISARLTEAKALGLLVDSGARRPTRSGRRAAVLIAP